MNWEGLNINWKELNWKIYILERIGKIIKIKKKNINYGKLIGKLIKKINIEKNHKLKLELKNTIFFKI